MLEGRFRQLVRALLAAAAREHAVRLAAAGAAACRHERLLAALGRSPLRQLLPGRARTALIVRLARRLRPAVAVG